MDNLLKHTLDYAEYLKNELGLNISFHVSSHSFGSLPRDIYSRLAPYNCHTNAYCMAVKSTAHEKCILNQKKIFSSLNSSELFCNVCHAGVFEYIFPITRNSTAIGFLTASGYKPPPEYASAPPINPSLPYDKLKAAIPQELPGTLLAPLALMLGKIFEEFGTETEDEYSLILQFLNEYHTSITLDDLAKHFNRSKSHISHLFKSENGLTIRAYCNNLKLEDARVLLMNTDMSISRIAYDTGFGDTSYFIKLFREKFGTAPLKYRSSSVGHRQVVN